MDLAEDFLAEGGAFAGLLAGEGAFEAAFVGDVVAAAAFEVEVDAAVVGIEVAVGVEGLVVEEVEREGVGDGGSEGFEEVE